MSDIELQLYLSHGLNFDVTLDRKNDQQSTYQLTQTEILTKKHIALSFAEKQMGTNNLSYNENTNIDVPGLLKDYSSNGKYDVGSILDFDDVSKLFSYNYDKTFGVDLSNYGINDVSNIQPFDGDYETDFGVYEKQSFDKYSVLDENANVVADFEQNDILPGYKIHFRIANKDVDTDASKCVLTYEMGVSYDNDPTHEIL
jgi:hypothetical protein